jgi:hypothetical protein
MNFVSKLDPTHQHSVLTVNKEVLLTRRIEVGFSINQTERLVKRISQTYIMTRSSATSQASYYQALKQMESLAMEMPTATADLKTKLKVLDRTLNVVHMLHDKQSPHQVSKNHLLTLASLES